MPNSPADTPNEIAGPNMQRKSLENKGERGEEKATILLLVHFLIKTSPCPLVSPLSEEATQSLQGQIVMGVQDYSNHSSSVRSPELCVCVWEGGHLSLLFFLLLTFFLPPEVLKGFRFVSLYFIHHPPVFCLQIHL